MKNTSLLLTALLVALPLALTAKQNSISVAILDFESKEDSIKDHGSKVAALLNAYLSTSDKIFLVERAELDKALGEQELGLSGTVSGETAAKVGQLTGAKVIISGKVMKVDKSVMLVAKVIGTETSRVYGELVKGPATQSLDELAMELAGKISTVVDTKAETLLAKTTTVEDRVVALKAQFKTAKRPTVSVSIPESHFGQPVVDPAAETELSLLLRECGFTLLDAKSGGSPDVEILGEAFSAFGSRRGNFVSCKARVEVKAIRKSDGKVIAIDRQTDVVADIAESTAAKSALQKAAADLAMRFIPKLVLEN